jgi:hypothetical protein
MELHFNWPPNGSYSNGIQFIVVGDNLPFFQASKSMKINGINCYRSSTRSGARVLVKA